MPVSRNQAELRTDKRTYTAKDLKRNDTDQYNRISEYGKMMAAFILSLRSNDVILMPDITFLGNGNEEILTNYHNAYRQGVHLKFNRGKVGNTENFSRSTVIKEKDLLELMDHLLVPLIEEMRAERLEEMAGSEINELSAEIKKTDPEIYRRERHYFSGRQQNDISGQRHTDGHFLYLKIDILQLSKRTDKPLNPRV